VSMGIPADTRQMKRPRIGRIRFASTWAARSALVVVVLMLMLALLGPELAPHDPDAQLGPAFGGPSSAAPLGFDYGGGDVLSRVLSGGRTVILYGALATLLAYCTGGVFGMVAGYRRGWVDPTLMRAVDVLLAFPPILFLLVLATGFGGGALALILGVAIVLMPGVARIVRAATLEISVRGYVEAAVARGDGLITVARREIAPNIVGTVVADAGPRFTVSILLVASVNFLGLGITPPQADWGLMIAENRAGMTINPLSVLVPALMIGILTVSLNMLADAVARSLGTSLDTEWLRR
jgi:peptide/nickel transport system permease protein